MYDMVLVQSLSTVKPRVVIETRSGVNRAPDILRTKVNREKKIALSYTTLRSKMDFRGINRFNVVVNAVSGNFLPLSENKTSMGIVPTVYIIFTWLTEFVYILTITIGLIFFSSIVRSIQEGGTPGAVSFEMLVLAIYMNSRREALRNVIRKINGILLESEDLRECVRDTVEPHKIRLKIYSIGGVVTITFWAGWPIIKIFYMDRFDYDDFTIPAYITEAPFGVNIFIVGIIIQTVGSWFCFLKKCAVDVYMSYLITILAAEYKFVREQLVKALRTCNIERDEESIIDDLRKCIQQHTVVIETGQMLIELFYVNIALTYLNCILRFCFLAFNLITVEDYFEKMIWVGYGTGCVIQIYMLCLCGQELLEASTSITENAFHENWYERGRTVKNIFRTIGLGNQIECRLSAFRVVDMTVPTFVSILNQAYSACLLILRVR